MSDPAITKPETPATPLGISGIFWLLLVAFALSAAALAGGNTQAIIVFAFVFVGWIISLCLHEFGHAYTAWRGGDASVVGRGYLTLNPLRYANPVLSIVVPLVFLALGGIGFPGGAVYLRPDLLRNPAWGAAVSAAGPAANLLCLIVLGGAYAMLDVSSGSPLAPAIALLAFLQATALLLNLLPVPGLDGFGILEAALPASARAGMAQLSRLAMIVFLGVMIGAPQLLAPLWQAALWLCEVLSIDREAIAQGFEAFRFWQVGE